MRIKTCPASVKSMPSESADDGEFEAIVSVFNNVDLVGDVVVPGAFADTIAEWKSSGDSLPVLWSHRLDDPHYNIGAVTEIEELSAGDPRIPDWADEWVKANGGLWVKAVIDTDADASPIAKQARRLLKQRRVTQFSYAYDVVDGGPATKDGEDVFELRKLRLFEVSPTQMGCNDLTELVSAKGMTGNQIVAATNLFRAVLDGTNPDGKAATREEPETVKRQESTRSDVASIRLRADLAFMECDVSALAS
jgi:hypothetical protein